MHTLGPFKIATPTLAFLPFSLFFAPSLISMALLGDCGTELIFRLLLPPKKKLSPSSLFSSLSPFVLRFCPAKRKLLLLYSVRFVSSPECPPKTSEWNIHIPCSILEQLFWDLLYQSCDRASSLSLRHEKIGGPWRVFSTSYTDRHLFQKSSPCDRRPWSRTGAPSPVKRLFTPQFAVTGEEAKSRPWLNEKSCKIQAPLRAWISFYSCFRVEARLGCQKSRVNWRNEELDNSCLKNP